MTMQERRQEILTALNIRPITTVILSRCTLCTQPIHAADDAVTYQDAVAHRDCAEVEVSCEIADLEAFANVAAGR